MGPPVLPNTAGKKTTVAAKAIPVVRMIAGYEKTFFPGPGALARKIMTAVMRENNKTPLPSIKNTPAIKTGKKQNRRIRDFEAHRS